MTRTIQHIDTKALWGDEDHLEVASKRSFSSLIFELLSEKIPTEQEAKLFELLLNLSIDHGSETPSAIKVIESAKEGKHISESISDGIRQINDSHGGAIEPAMELLYQIKQNNLDVDQLIGEYIEQKKIIAGFGHRLYKDIDPRAELILTTLQDANIGHEYRKIADQIVLALEKKKGKKLPLNIDGAIAIVLCTFGWDPNLGKAVFIIARIPGLCGQYLNAKI